MLAEYFHSTEPFAETMWCTVMPGVQVCRFSLKSKESIPTSFTLKHKPLHFETFFCHSGGLVLKGEKGGALQVGAREILLLSDTPALCTAEVTAPLAGWLVAVDAVNARGSLQTLCGLLGELQVNTAQVRQLMTQRDGCILLRGVPWSWAVFAALKGLTEMEQGRYCVLKAVELLYLLCTRSFLLKSEMNPAGLDTYLLRIVADIQGYMASHLDEKLTIYSLSQKFRISSTALKSGFRYLYGQPIHSWLQQQRMERAAELLHATPMTVLQVAQMVGYESVSQFQVGFKRRYGMTPGQYRKMSETGEA